MRGGFGSFYFKVTRLISCTITVNLLEEFIEFVDDCYPELGPNLASAATVKDVMKAIRTKCNVINIAPVEEVVSFYSIKEAKPLITDYKVTVDEFCCTFKLQFLLDKKLSTSDFLVCETIEFVLDWDPAEHLLNDIRRLMEKAFKGLSRRIIVKSMHKGNSIIIICGAPGHLINALQLRVRDNLSVLQQEFDLMRLKIGHYTVYDIMIKKKEQKIIAEQIEMCEGEIQKLNPYNDDNKNLLNNQAPKILSLIKNQEFIRSTMKSSDYKLKLKQIEREKSASTKKRMLLRENEHLQSTLRVRIIQKEALQHNEQEIEKLQESISFISVQLLNNKEKLTHVFTQTTLSSSGSICVAQADYNNTIISFKKGEIFQLSKNGYEVQSLETGQKGAVPISCVGPSLLESLHLFQFAMTNQTLPLPPILLDETISDDEKAKHFIKIIADDNHTLQLLRTQNFKQHKWSVLIKTNITADITQERFLKEANILKKLNYESIICLYGVCTKEYPFYIVTELMNHGNLKKHLSRYSFAPAELIYITAQVVNGMIYLGEQYYIHCDLRAANILVGEYNTVKIANFHFAQHLNGNKYWIIEERTKLAIRWTAPEWHTLNRLGIKSDVWSFGILLWELVTKGNLPYPGMTNVEVVEAVPQGYRMIIPEDCPEPFQQLMFLLPTPMCLPFSLSLSISHWSSINKPRPPVMNTTFQTPLIKLYFC
uniref:Protein kinase domain-containing protein n=1 Tax=Amphimedon queenslandica TaxID=400682 RepID=A0A1X7U317_AMPQE